MKKWINWSIFAAVGLFLAVATLIFHYFILPLAIKYQVTKTLALEKGSEAWDRFVVTPIPLILNIYLFQLENPEGVLNGEKPKVSEVGPYVYREQWDKVDIHIDEEKDRVFYRQRINYTFDQELSGNLSETDRIITINPIIHMVAEIIDAFPTLDVTTELMEFGFPEMMGDMYGPAVNVRVRDLLFDGVKMHCGNSSLSFMAKLFCRAVTRFLPLYNLEALDNGDLAATALKYKRLSPVFEMNRGVKEPDKLGRILSVDGQHKLTSWSCDSANVVDGFDMAMMSPYVTRTTLPIFSYDLQTTAHMPYQKDTNYEGIDGYRFILNADMMGDPETNPGARCYCPGSVKNLTIANPCLKGYGVLDASSSLGVPAYISKPHFLDASENYKSMVDGLHPEEQLHQSYIDVEPTTGVPLQGMRRIQVNVKARKTPAITLLKNHTDALIPLIWIDEGAKLGGKEISMLKDQLLLILNIANITRWSLFSIGLLFLVIGVTMAVIRKKQEDNDMYDIED